MGNGVLDWAAWIAAPEGRLAMTSDEGFGFGGVFLGSDLAMGNGVLDWAAWIATPQGRLAMTRVGWGDMLLI
jgi:hypothetical protein